jgi:hypothetical protein
MMVPELVVVVSGNPLVTMNQCIAGLASERIEIDGDKSIGVQLCSTV